MKSKITISVIGSINSGKTTVTRLIAKALIDADIETNVTWGIDGPPKPPEFQEKQNKAIACKTKVSITEFQAGRVTERDNPGDVKVTVAQVSGNYTVTLTMYGLKFPHDFGAYSYSQEKARAAATRLAMELDVDVIDNTRNDIEWVQPQ